MPKKSDKVKKMGITSKTDFLQTQKHNIMKNLDKRFSKEKQKIPQMQ